MDQPRHASWSCLPAPLVERIVRQAFQDSGRAVLQWLRLSLVCRCECCHGTCTATVHHFRPGVVRKHAARAGA